MTKSKEKATGTHLIWEESSSTRIWEEYGRVGDVWIFKVFYDCFSGADNKMKWRMEGRLPGFQKNLGLYEDLKRAHLAADSFLERWTKKLGLEFKSK